MNSDNELVNLLRENGYKVVEGAEAVKKAIKEAARK